MFKRVDLGIGLFAAALQAGAATTEAGLKDFLVDSSGSYVGAAGIIGLDGQVVRDVATPKEFVASINSVRSSESKDGVGVAFTPGRSRFERAVINLREVAADKAPSDLLQSPLRRLWGATTFSYAQKRGAIEGAGDFKHWAYAVNTEYYWNLADDPAMAAFAAFTREKKDGGECESAAKLVDHDPSKLAEALKQVRLWVTESALAEARAAAGTGKNDEAAKKDSAKDLVKELDACVKAASKAATNKWNAPKMTLLMGRGYLQGSGAADPRYSLGNHVQLGLSMSPKQLMRSSDPADSRGQLTLSIKRSTRAVDTTTLATTPVYKNLSLAALRYTHALGTSTDALTSYLLAEVSNVKSKDGPVAAGTFKYAGGWDYKLGANMWLELRVGRSVARSGAKEETKSLLALKFSPEASLSSLVSPK